MKENYMQPRKKPERADIELHLLEVNNVCPLCGTYLRKKEQLKRVATLYEIAHIYPNSPTSEQLETLKDVEVLGENCESFENKIALCINCHRQQDFHTSRTEYERLLNIKKRLMREATLKESADSLDLEKDIKSVIVKLTNIKSNDWSALNLKAVPLANKFSEEDTLLKNKVQHNINQYYYFVKNEFQILDGVSFSFKLLCAQMRSAFLKLEKNSASRIEIFNNLVNWIFNKTGSINIIACEAIVSFFVQNCEVFNEISE